MVPVGLPTLFDGNHHGWYSLLISPQQMEMSWENVAIWKRVVLEFLERYIETSAFNLCVNMTYNNRIS